MQFAYSLTNDIIWYEVSDRIWRPLQRGLGSISSLLISLVAYHLAYGRSTLRPGQGRGVWIDLEFGVDSLLNMFKFFSL